MTTVNRKSSVKYGRPLDFAYDPSFIVSGQKDYEKHAFNSRIALGKYAICPIFPTMFSDLRNYPRKQYVFRTMTTEIPEYVPPKDEKVRAVTNMRSVTYGSQRFKYHQNPNKTGRGHDATNCFYSVDIEKAEKEKAELRKIGKNSTSKSCQTIYRETSVQTLPWEPDYRVAQGEPELLELDFLKWGDGLPAGMHEIQLIERARMKKQWAKAMPPLIDQKAFNERRNVIEAMERNQWLFREQEIQDIQNLRLELLEKMLKELQAKSKCRNEKKMRMFCDYKMKEKQEKIMKFEKTSKREKRRLEFSYKGILSKYGPVNVFDEHADFKSELYTPLIRHGTNPKYAHQLLTTGSKKYKPQYYGVENYETLPPWLDKVKVSTDMKVPGTSLCKRETKWNAKHLKMLYDELKKLGQEEKISMSLRVRIEEKLEAPPTPEIEDYDDNEEEMYQHSVVLQSILRGRAAQVSIFQGRDKCRELIEELRSNFTLLHSNKSKMMIEKETTKLKQFEANRCTERMKYLETALKKIGGDVMGTLLDFLNKELSRLHKERACHAMALLVERERRKREAAEAGRRQQEIQRRKEHDEIFKQSVKIRQETVDLYLQNIIKEGMDFNSEEEAKIYIENLTDTIQQQSEELEERRNDVHYKEEYIADLVHHFVVPEVEKVIISQRNKAKEKLNLQLAHEEIFGNLEVLTKPQPQTICEADSLITDAQVSQNVDTTADQFDVAADMRNLLEELITIPVKREALDKMMPCLPVGDDEDKHV